MRRVAAALVLGATLALAACDSGPAGPGTLTVAVDAPVQLGAVQLRVSGTGITGVRALSDVEVAARLESETQSEQVWRIVAFAPGGGPIRLGVEVESTDTRLAPVALGAADAEGAIVGVAGVGVRVER